MAQEAMAQVEEAKAPVKEAEELLRSAEGLRARESGEAVGQKLKAEAKKLKFGTLEALCEERFLRALAEDEPLPAAEQQPPEEAWKAELKRIEQRNTDLKREIASFISSLCAKLPAARSQATSLAEQADSLTALEEEVSRDAPTTDSESDLKFLESEVQQLREQVGSTEQEAEQLANENAEAERDVEAAENETSQITSELTSLRALESGIRSSKELLGEAHQALERSNDQYGWLSQLTGVSIADVTAGSVTVRYDGDCGTYDITVAFEPGTKRIADIRTSPDNEPVHDILASGKEQPQNGCAKLLTLSLQDWISSCAYRISFCCALLQVAIRNP
jgi:DNA repair exonuclease SbcCD ATPase subunit